MKEANIFETWANSLVEGTWATPDTPEKQAELVRLMSAEFPVGADATNATEQLYDLIGDDELFDRLQELAASDANADARQTVYDRMQELANDPDIAQVMTQFTMDMDTPADPAEPVQEGQMKELMSRDAERMEREDFVDKYGGEDWVGEFWDNIMGDDNDAVPEKSIDEESNYPEYQDDLSDILKNAGVDTVARAAPDYELEITDETANPGVTPADIDGVPAEVDEDYGIERESVMHGDYAEEKNRMRKLAGMTPDETDEGWKGAAVGGALGKIGGEMVGGALGPIGSAIGGALGGSAGAMIGDKLGGPDEEEQLNEVIGPALAAGAKALMPLLSKIGPALGRMASKGGQAAGQAAKQAAPAVGQAAKQGAQAVGQVAKQGAEIVAKNAAPIGVGVGAYQAITDTAKSLVGGVGEVYSDMGSAIDAITKMVGDSLDSFSIKSLAEAAVKYAIPIGILIAVLYGGKKIIDSIFSESAINEATCNMTEAGRSCPQHGLEECAMEGQDHSPLAGQYGHSGKMKPVDKDVTFLDRLKELSGM